MQLRKNILPKTPAEAAVTLFMIIIIPVVYWFELFIVIPTYYEPWTFWHILHFLTGSFIMLNITSNYISMLLCDTSIRGQMLPSTLEPKCQFCTVCEAITPPRSFHCSVCNICILKRDHHCMFASCCIGHHNLRYFLIFTVYLFIACSYATYYNVFFVRNLVSFNSWMSIVKVIFPLAMFMVHFDTNQSFVLLSLIVGVGCAFTGVLSYYHFNLMLRGRVTHERKDKDNIYSLGKWENMRQVLGQRWYLVWLSPFVRSELPQDGIRWKTRETLKSK